MRANMNVPVVDVCLQKMAQSQTPEIYKNQALVGAADRVDRLNQKGQIKLEGEYVEHRKILYANCDYS